MISGNRRIPLVYSNQKAKDPIFFRYMPDKLRIIKFGCVCSQPTPPAPIPTEVFYRYYLAFLDDPNISGRLNYATIIFDTPISIKISVTDINGVDQTQFLQQMSTATTITLRSVITPTTYYNLTITSFTSDSAYWTYYYTLLSSFGSLIDDEQIKITYS